jgi:hypothetical protein
MPRVLFTISYAIKPEVRTEYLTFAKTMQNHFTDVVKKEYTVYEVKGKKNHFVEVFLSRSLEEFDTLEDNQDEKTQEVVSRLHEFIDDEGMKYQTLVELD